MYPGAQITYAPEALSGNTTKRDIASAKRKSSLNQQASEFSLIF